MWTSRCYVDPGSCSWSFSHERERVVEAEWRLHYAAHLRGAAALANYAAHGTVHPQPPQRYSADADHNRTQNRIRR